MAPTPTNHDVPPEVLPLREEGDSQQGVEIQALHQQPEVAGHDAVLEEDHHGLAAHLMESQHHGSLVHYSVGDKCTSITIPMMETDLDAN